MKILFPNYYGDIENIFYPDNSLFTTGRFLFILIPYPYY